MRARQWLATALILLPCLAGAAESTGPIVAGDSLWKLFDRTASNAGADRFAWMVAVQRLNPGAFRAPCNAATLKIGSSLQLPTSAQVAAVDAAAAQEELRRQASTPRGTGHCSAWFDGLVFPPAAAPQAAQPVAATTPKASSEVTPPPTPPATTTAGRVTEPAAEAGIAAVTAAATNETRISPGMGASAAAVGGPPAPAAEASGPAAPVAASAVTSTPKGGKALEHGSPPAVAPVVAVPSSPGYRIPLTILLALLLALSLWRLASRRFAATLLRRTSYRRRMLIAVSLVVVVGQSIYAVVNVASFQHSYLQSVQEQSRRLAEYLRQDIEHVLDLGIPLHKLIKMEASLAAVLGASPEIEKIEITNLDHQVVYYADQQTMERVKAGERTSFTQQGASDAKASFFGIDRSDTDLRLPIRDNKRGQQAGFIELRISSAMIQATTHEIIWDIATVILVSLLITAELLGFFVNRGFSGPLRRLTAAFDASHPEPIPREQRLALPGLERLVEFRNRCAATTAVPPAIAVETACNDIERSLTALRDIGDETAQRARELLCQIRERIASKDAPGKLVQKAPLRYNYNYIRPFVFLFFVAYNLPLSFFPLYVKTFAQPSWGMDPEVMVGLPISVFMLFFALSMLASGGWLDRVGWRTPLLTGAFIFSVGFLLTAFSADYLYMLIFRAVTAVGLGIGFMAFQQFVIEHTDAKERNIGMASFLGAFFAGEIVGTVIGGMLADRLGYGNIFMLSSVVAGFCLIGMLLFFDRDHHTPPIHHRVTMGQYLGALRDREFLAVVVFQAIPAKVALVGFLMYFVPLYLSQLGTLQSDIGRIAMGYGLVIVLLGPVLSRYLTHPGLRRYYVLTGGLITGISMIGFAFASHAYVVLLLVTGLGIAHAFSLSAQASLVAETHLVRRLGSGTGMGIFRFWERFGNVAAPFIMAALIAQSGYQRAVVDLGIGITLSSLIYILLLRGIPSIQDQQPIQRSDSAKA